MLSSMMRSLMDALRRENLRERGKLEGSESMSMAVRPSGRHFLIRDWPLMATRE